MNADRKFYLLVFFVIALIAAQAYLYIGIHSLGAEAARIRVSIIRDVSAMRLTTTEMTTSGRERLDQILRELDATKRESAMAAMLAKFQAQVGAEQLAADLARKHQRQRELLGEQLGTIRLAAAETSRKIGDLSAEATEAREDASLARADADRTAVDVARVQAGIVTLHEGIAMNREELEALRAESGEREYTEFSIAKSKKPVEVAGLKIALKKAEADRNLFSLEVTAAGKTITQRDRNINEPLRFSLEPGHRRYEIVVNEVGKDLISGYVVSPRAQMTAQK